MFTQITAFKVEHFSIDQILSLYFNSEKRPDVIKINYDFIMRENRKKLANLKLGNQKKIDKIKALKLKLF